MFLRVRGSAAYLGDCVLNDLLVGHITLVAHEELVDTLGGVAVDLLKPLLDVVEGVHIRDIVDNADTVGAAVVGRGDGTEAFLAGSIPLYQANLVSGSVFPRCQGVSGCVGGCLRSEASRSCHRAR